MENIAEILFIGKAGATSDDLQRKLGVPQQSLGLLDLHPQQLCFRRAVKMAMETPFQFTQG